MKQLLEQANIIDRLNAVTDDLGLFNPDVHDSRYSLVENAKALMAVSAYSGEKTAAELAKKYADFILNCQQDQGFFFNYMNESRQFSDANYHINLCEPNGYAVEALAQYMTAFPVNPDRRSKIDDAFKKVYPKLASVHTLSAIGRVLRGMILYYRIEPCGDKLSVILMLANKLVQSFRRESSSQWQWFDNRLAISDAVVPASLLEASVVTDNKMFREIARKTMVFLLESTFTEDGIRVETISSFKSASFRTHPRLAEDFASLLNFTFVFHYFFGGFDDWVIEIRSWFDSGEFDNETAFHNGEKEEQNREEKLLEEIFALQAMNRFSGLKLVPAERKSKASVVKDAVSKITDEIRILSGKIEAIPELYMAITQSPLYISGQLEQHAIDRLGAHLDFLREKYTKHLQSRGISA